MNNVEFEKRKTIEQVEESTELAPKFDSNGLKPISYIPCTFHNNQGQFESTFMVNFFNRIHDFKFYYISYTLKVPDLVTTRKNWPGKPTKGLY